MVEMGYLMSKHSGGRSSSSSMNNGDEEFEEADVWEAAHDHGHDPRSSSNFMMKKSKSSNSFANSSSTKKKAPRSSHESSSTSSMGAHHHHHHHHHGGQPQSSGPLLAPGWPHNSAGLSHRSSSKPDFCNSGYQEQQDEDEEEMIPPHEFIARRLARTQISASVCEGAGRTLKGRDLSRVRNAILTKTGFLEQ
uniref:Senescence regulator n=1 Tax=Kalanchoe fedtschenkoi TaxID=63787 RepID=A0A7N0UJD7_KALFE